MSTQRREAHAIEGERTFAPGRISVVVPTRNSGRTLTACLASAREQRDTDLELIVVDNHSTDSTQDDARLADKVVVAGPERSAQRNIGAQVATGEFVAFVDSDMRLTADIARQALAAFAADPALVGLVIPEVAEGQGFFARCRELEKRLYLGAADVEAARIFRRALFLDAGGYDEAITGPEDWELPDRLSRGGGSIGRVTASVVHDEGRVRLLETFRKKRYYGRGLPAYLSRSRARGVRRVAHIALLAQPGLLLRQPILALGLGLLKTVEAAGLFLGALESWARPAPVGGEPS